MGAVLKSEIECSKDSRNVLKQCGLEMKTSAVGN